MKKQLLIVLAASYYAAPTLADDWKPLSENSVGPKFCQEFKETSPAKEYFEVTKCDWDGQGTLGRSNLQCKKKGEFEKFNSNCSDGILKCNLVPKAVTSKAPKSYATMFEGLLLVHNKEMIEKLIHLPKSNQHLGGSCLSEDSFPFEDGVLGIGITGNPEQVAVLDNLLADDWRVKELVGGAAMRLQIAQAYWWLGNKAGDKNLIKLLTLPHVKRYPGREFREVLLSALAEWKSDAAVEVCGENLRDFKNDADLGACMLYLARRGKKEYEKKMIRQSERARSVGPISLGILGSKKAKAHLKSLKKEKGDGPAYFALDVANYIAGDAKSWKKIQETMTKRSTPDRGNFATLAFIGAKPKKAKKVISFLKKNEKKWKKERKERAAMSVAVRAQLGDKSAIKALVKLLESPDGDVRKAATQFIGGDWGNVWNYMPGLGVVADPKLLPALAEAHDNESNESEREKIARAALNVRAAIRARKK